ncbi:hypothetical protein K8O68_09040 [Salipaludibacillus sp. CUR1]|uniref:hypothetical protein n=1 Tax=Salipaludibacillus TaxID=1884449 RepID=UPI0015A5904B|nr:MULTISPECIES: hypothetical protein [Salipaludibacillus]MCE7792561.1 hypothetical protein [Salipaludibacillus sp. CUR1]
MNLWELATDSLFLFFFFFGSLVFGAVFWMRLHRKQKAVEARASHTILKKK